MTVPDFSGLHFRLLGGAAFKVLLGRDSRSVRALVPDPRMNDRGFHEVTLVNMGDTAAPDVSVTDLSLLRLQWPVSIVNSLSWLQQELEQLRKESKQCYRDTRAAGCSFCGKWIKLDMNRHVVNYHLNLAQLWCCPVSGCTVWKGTPQDCMDHLRVAHAVPAAVKSANLGKWFPPWTVRRQTWTDTLKPSNSGISTDVLLFSELGLPLVHHYRVLQKGTSHVSLRGDYLTRLRTFVTQSAAMSRWGHSTTIRASHLPLRTVCVPRETSGSGIRMRNLPANLVVQLAGRALPMRRMPQLSWCRLRQSRLKIRVPSFTIAGHPSCRCQFGWRDYGGIVLLFSAELPIQVIPPGEVRRDWSCPISRSWDQVSQPDVLRGDAACIRVVPLGCNQYRPFCRLLVSTVRHTTWRLWDYGAAGCSRACTGFVM